MVERVVTITNRAGIHARPAAAIARTAGRFRSDIRFIKDDLTVDGKSIMGIITLGAPYGTRLTMQCEGPDEKEMADAVERLFTHRFEEGA